MSTATNASIRSLIRPNLLGLSFYKSARGTFSGKADVLLDANENPYGPGELLRYPDPVQKELKAVASEVYDVAPESIFVSNGSDAAIDLLIRLFCRPGHDRVIHLPPTFGMYKVAAGINDVELVSVPLDKNMQPRVEEILAGVDPERDKILFLCTPNNPVGTAYRPELVMELIEKFPGIVAVDQAYEEFSPYEGYRHLINSHPRLVVTQTMSKAYGLAGARIGFVFANPEIIEWLTNIKAPYNISSINQQLALEALKNRAGQQEQIERLTADRKLLEERFSTPPLNSVFTRLYPSAANFILAETADGDGLYQFLLTQGIVVRNQTAVFGRGHLRITVGTPEENERLLAALEAYAAQN